MIKKILLIATVYLVTILSAQARQDNPVPVIFDTDMGPDYDDVGAITLLHAFADNGDANILATIGSTNYVNVGPVLSVLNTYFKKPQIPVGVPKGKAVGLRDWQHWSDTLVTKYPHTLKSNEEAEDAIVLYRKILSAQPDNSVTIVTVGFFTNLSGLLQSSADKYSSLSGKDLVKKKVKLLVSMAGGFPSGNEFNVNKDASASKNVAENWPTQILFSGFEIGKKIKCGLPLIHNDAIHNSPVKDVFRISIPMAAEDKDGRMSWDETAVLVAVKGYADFYTIQRGTIHVDEKDGSNTWTNDEKGRHAHLIERAPVEEVRNVIDKLMMHQPK
ncbi:nucleoside hydrolase [Danxiaibacter flavus]|uniref:Nucleoside hydrolase n=1 Tax=Danxiaibacter flavus TaxID=3049108 RepID=A0ABV3ZEW5_9BACT|nr:nucleoside hydrolase [Chitinophagaceae bacterium DXS]